MSQGHLSAKEERDDRNVYNRKQKEVRNVPLETMLLRWDLVHGEPAEIWRVSERQVREFVKANNLSSISSEARRSVVRGPAAKTSHERAIAIEEIRDTEGGMRSPHLHCRGETYLLDTKQWRELSGGIISDFRKKLAKSKTVNFEQFMELADTMNVILKNNEKKWGHD